MCKLDVVGWSTIHKLHKKLDVVEWSSCKLDVVQIKCRRIGKFVLIYKEFGISLLGPNIHESTIHKHHCRNYVRNKAAKEFILLVQLAKKKISQEPLNTQVVADSESAKELVIWDKYLSNICNLVSRGIAK